MGLGLRPGAKAPDQPPMPYRLRASPRLYRGGQMIQRWVASALVEAEPRFRRVRDYRVLQHLVGALGAMAPPDGLVADVA